MSVTIAKNAGFCFGVKRATDRLERAFEERRQGERIYTLGIIIHNGTYNAMLAEKGIMTTSMEEIDDIARSACKDSPVTVFIRAHGIPDEDEKKLLSLSRKNEFFRIEDCTCPYVKKIHKIASENSKAENAFFLLGAAEHPEVVGIMSYFDYEKLTFNSADELLALAEQGYFVKINNKTPVLASQTTQNLTEWKKAKKF